MADTPTADPPETAAFASPRDDGLMAYVVTKTNWGREWTRIEWAATLADAKRQFGWTREQHTSIKVRRARVADMGSTVPDDLHVTTEQVPDAT